MFRTGLTSVILPNSVTSLGIYCFGYCTDLTLIRLPNSVTSIGTNCFTNCTGLTSVILPNSVTSLGNGCFYNCTGLTEISLKWTSSSKIVAYNSNWLNGASSFSHFNIPAGTTSLYTAKGYPANKLVEES